MIVNLGPLGQQDAATVAIVVGALLLGAASAYIGNIIRVAFSIFVLPGKPLRSFGAPGTWAVVTGASDGIGKEYALQLAQKGYNLVLASRTESKLVAIREQITSAKSNAKVEILPIDFAANKSSDYDRLSSMLQGKHVSILINNVGQSHAVPIEFVDTPAQEINNIITVNCLATLKVTQLVIPHMIPHKNGLVITMGSFGGMIPTPLLATYSGSKAFLQQWSNALAGELGQYGITVHFVLANIVTSSMSKVRRTSWSIPSEKVFVKAALSKIGRKGGAVNYTRTGVPYWGHAVLAALVTGWYGIYNARLLEYNRKLHVSIRKRALAKVERDKQKAKKTT